MLRPKQSRNGGLVMETRVGELLGDACRVKLLLTPDVLGRKLGCHVLERVKVGLVHLGIRMSHTCT